MTSVEHNKRKVRALHKRSPFNGKAAFVFVSMDFGGAEGIFLQLCLSLNWMGFTLLPTSLICKPNYLNWWPAKFLYKFVLFLNGQIANWFRGKLTSWGNEHIPISKMAWIDYAIEAAAENVIAYTQRMRGHDFGDHKEPRD